MSKHWFTSSSGKIEIELTLNQALTCSHAGDCDFDVSALSRVPAVATQLAALDPATLRAELHEYGAWEDHELREHRQNLQRVLWLACCDIVEEYRSKRS